MRISARIHHTQVTVNDHYLQACLSFMAHNPPTINAIFSAISKRLLGTKSRLFKELQQPSSESRIFKCIPVRMFYLVASCLAKCNGANGEKVILLALSQARLRVSKDASSLISALIYSECLSPRSGTFYSHPVWEQTLRFIQNFPDMSSIREFGLEEYLKPYLQQKPYQPEFDNVMSHLHRYGLVRDSGDGFWSFHPLVPYAIAKLGTHCRVMRHNLKRARLAALFNKVSEAILQISQSPDETGQVDRLREGIFVEAEAVLFGNVEKCSNLIYLSDFNGKVCIPRIYILPVWERSSLSFTQPIRQKYLWTSRRKWKKDRKLGNDKTGRIGSIWGKR